MPRLSRALAVLALAVAGAILVPASAADARVAAGGDGRYLGEIDWFEWGLPDQVLSGVGMRTVTNATTVGGDDLFVTCALSNFGGVSLAYRPGSWMGDALEELYGIGGVDSENTLIDGVATPFGSKIPTTFRYACSATLDDRPIELGGVVFADAEQSVAPERVSATISSSATWRIIDRLRSPGCDSSTAAGRSDDGVTDMLRLDGTTLCKTGPAVVTFADGATSGTAEAYSPAGRSAVALGVLVPIDRGDAPASYGEAGHLLGLSFEGGELPETGSSDVGDPAFALAKPAQPVPRLGDSVDPGGAASEDGAGDDTADAGGAFAPGDDETDDPPPSMTVTPGMTLTQPDVACTGPGFVSGWIDFDASGTFDPDERSQTALCDEPSVQLRWTVPADVTAQGRTFQRLRIAALPADITRPTGFADGGETEDHALALDVPAGPPPPVTTQSEPPPPPPPPPPVLPAPLAPPASTLASTPDPDPSPPPPPAQQPQPSPRRRVRRAR